MKKVDKNVFISDSDTKHMPGFSKDPLLSFTSTSKQRSWSQKLSGFFGCVHSALVDDNRIKHHKQDTININVYLPKLPNSRRRTLILDLDETLVHSSFVPIRNYDILISVEITGRLQNVYVKKRPHVDEFLSRVKDLYEVVIFTASLPVYADPVITQLDGNRVVSYRLFRQHCIRTETGYVKDLSYLGRDLDDTVIVDNSPQSYSRQPNNAVPISSWFGDSESDRTLIDIVLPVLEEIANHKGSVYECTRRFSLSSATDISWFTDQEGKLNLDKEDDKIIASMLSPAALKNQ